MASGSCLGPAAMARGISTSRMGNKSLDSHSLWFYNGFMESVNLNAKSGLMDAIRYFSDPMVCLETVSKAKWSKGPECPRCQSKKLSFIKTRLLWTCLACRKQFSVKVGT